MSGKVVRDVVGRVVWLGKGAVFLVGIAVIFALPFAGAIAVANAVLGSGDGTVLSIESDGGSARAAKPGRRGGLGTGRGGRQVGVSFFARGEGGCGARFGRLG
jgi:hypothetical protein